MKNRKVVFIGGDKRSFFCAEAMYRHGFEPVLFGFGKLPEKACSTRCDCLGSCLDGSAAAVLPIPVSKDGENLYTEGNEKMPLRDVLAIMPKGLPIFGGAVSDMVKHVADEYSAEIIDCMSSETHKLCGSAATAEGAICLAMQSSEGTIFGSRSLVCGFGRIGEALAHRLRGLYSEVTVFARRDEVLNKARLYGFSSCTRDSLSSEIRRSDFIFNTVPENIFDAELLESFGASQHYIELASFPFGIGKSDAEKYGINIVDGTFLPARYCPESAGEYMAHEILSRL